MRTYDLSQSHLFLTNYEMFAGTAKNIIAQPGARNIL